MSEPVKTIILASTLALVGFILAEIMFAIRDLRTVDAENKAHFDQLEDVKKTQELFRLRIRANEQNILKFQKDVMKRKKIKFENIVDTKHKAE